MAGNGKVISLGSILLKITKKPIVKDLTNEHAANLALDFLELIGAPMAYSSKTSVIFIEDNRGVLPDDLLYIEGIRYKGDNSCSINGIPLRESSNTFHMSKCNDLKELTYKVQGNFIFTSFIDGNIEIAYKSIDLDEYGFPFIPNNVKVRLGIENYIIANYLSGLNDIGKVPDKVYNKYEQKSLFYLSAASSGLNMPSPDKMETIMNGLNRLISRTYMHRVGFSGFGIKEQFKKY